MMLFKSLGLSFRAAKQTSCLISSFSSKPRYSLIRRLSIKNRQIATAGGVPLTAPSANKDDAGQFLAVFPDLVRDLTYANHNMEIPEATKWFAKVLDYNVPDGKKNRGLSVVTSYKLLMEKDLTEEGLFLAQVVGWCVEMLQASFLIQDDLEDGSVTRRNRLCWYRTHDLGVKAINDATFLDSAIYRLLRQYIRCKPYYLDVVELFHDLTLKTIMGQCLDLHCLTDENRPKFELFTMDRYKAIVKYKTSYFTFHLPVALAMFMAGIKDPELHRQASIALLEIGHFFQVQDDYLDCFGNPEVTGKLGTDIEDGKCSWLVVLALQRANKQQRQIIEDCYGYSNPEKIDRIKRLYEELDIPNAFRTYEDESYSIILTHIQEMSQGLPHDIFFTLMKKIYHRNS